MGVIVSLSAESLDPLEKVFIIILDDSHCQCRTIYRINAPQCHCILLMNIKILFGGLFYKIVIVHILMSMLLNDIPIENLHFYDKKY